MLNQFWQESFTLLIEKFLKCLFVNNLNCFNILLEWKFFLSLNENISFFFVNQKIVFLHYFYFEEQQNFIFIFALISLVITVVFFSAAFLYSHIAIAEGGIFLSQPSEKAEEYECGYGPFWHSTENWVALQFFVVGILFLIFDLELALLFVFANYIGHVSGLSIFVTSVFIIMLVIGFIYEWSKGALDWK